MCTKNVKEKYSRTSSESKVSENYLLKRSIIKRVKVCKHHSKLVMYRCFLFFLNAKKT